MAGTAAETMQLGLVALAMVFLSSMGHSERLSKVRRQRRGEFHIVTKGFHSISSLPVKGTVNASSLVSLYKTSMDIRFVYRGILMDLPTKSWLFLCLALLI